MENHDENNEILNTDMDDLSVQYADRIKEFQMKPKTRVFIISSKFVKGLESYQETKKVPKVQNAELKNAFNVMSSSLNPSKNKKKGKGKSQKNKNLQINKDYYPVDEKLWNEIVFHFGGGPEISYYVCDDGTLDLANFQINVKCGTEKKCIQTSMKTDLQTFHILVLDAFGYDINDKYKLCPNNSAAPISTEGTVGGRIANEKLLILTVHDPEKPENPKQTNQQQQVSEKKQSTTNEKKKIIENKSNENKSNENAHPLGLKNTGNSCYMNSVIQCFSCVDPFLKNLNLVQNEANVTFETAHHLAEKETLRGLSARLHYGQYETTTKFITLISNLKNNIPLKNDDHYFTKPNQSKKGGRRNKNQKYKSSYNTSQRIQSAISLKKSMSLFSNNEQQDAHEFFSFLLDAVHDESPKSIEKLFYGKCKRTTTCAHCGHESVIIEDFSSLPLPISMARKVLYSPYDLTKQLQRIDSIPENVKEKVILIGKTRKGNVIATKMSPDFFEVIALEIPDLTDSNQNPESNLNLDEITKTSSKSKYANVEILDDKNLEKEVDTDSDNETSDENFINEDNKKDNENKEGNTNNEDNKKDNENKEENTNNTDNKKDNENKEGNTNNEDDKKDNENKEENTNNEDNKKDNENKEGNTNNEDNKKDNENKEENTNNTDNKKDNENKEGNTNNTDNKKDNENSTNNEINEKDKEENKNINENKSNNDEKVNKNEEDNTNKTGQPISDANYNHEDENNEKLNNDKAEDQTETETTYKNVEYGVALLRVINKKTNEKTLPLLIKVPLNIQLSEDLLRNIIRERLAPMLHQPDSEIKLIAPPKMLEMGKNKPLANLPIACHINSLMKPTRLETLFTKSEIPISVDELLDSFFSKMQLDENNMWLCEVCKNNSCAYQQVRLLDTKTTAAEEMQNKNINEQQNENENNVDKESDNQQAEIKNNEQQTNNENKEPNPDQQTNDESKEPSKEQLVNNENKEPNNEQLVNNENKEPNNEQQTNNENNEQQTNNENNEQLVNNENKESSNEQQTSGENKEQLVNNENKELNTEQQTNNENNEQPTTNENEEPNKKDENSFHLPKCIVLQLKRFLSKNGRLAKDSTTVIIPQYINLSRYIEMFDPNSDEKETELTNNEERNDNKYLYKLSSVSNHAGSLQGGHYTAYGERNGRWYTFNDSIVSSNNSIFSSNKSNDCFGSSNAYLLFYSKVEEPKQA